MLEIVGREADGGRRCMLVGCGTALIGAGPPLGSACGPLRAATEAHARVVDPARGYAVVAAGEAARASLARPFGGAACSWHRPVGSPSDPS